jgi:hypothetical protein
VGNAAGISTILIAAQGKTATVYTGGLLVGAKARLDDGVTFVVPKSGLNYDWCRGEHTMHLRKGAVVKNIDFQTVDMPMLYIHLISSVKLKRPAGSDKEVPARQGITQVEPTEQSLVSSVPPPIVTFGARSESLLPGEETTVEWDVANATKVTIDGEEVDTAGRFAIAPKTTSVFRLRAEGEGGITLSEVTTGVIRQRKFLLKDKMRGPVKSRARASSD